MTRVGDYLRRQRRGRDLTLADIAGRVGVGVSTYHDYEAGRVVPPLDRCESIAEAVGVPVSALRALLDKAHSKRGRS